MKQTIHLKNEGKIVN